MNRKKISNKIHVKKRFTNTKNTFGVIKRKGFVAGIRSQIDGNARVNRTFIKGLRR